jgi:hypothetical protein
MDEVVCPHFFFKAKEGEADFASDYMEMFSFRYVDTWFWIER